MAIYYADSSALVKRHVIEAGTAWMQALCLPENNNVIITARLSMVEVYSALNRRVREANLEASDYLDLENDFTVACLSDYQLVELTPEVVEQAKGLLERHLLRAYDAVQLAAARVANAAIGAAGLPPLIFLAADDRLLAAAQAEGLQADNPSMH